MWIFELEVVLEQRLVVQRLEPQLVAGVRRVGDQFAQEDLAIRVQRMDHELQELPDFGLEAQGLAVGCGQRLVSVTAVLPRDGESFYLGAGQRNFKPRAGRWAQRAAARRP